MPSQTGIGAHSRNGQSAELFDTLASPVGALARCVLGSALLGALIDDAGQTKACVRSMCQKHVPEACARNICKVVRCSEIQVD